MNIEGSIHSENDRKPAADEIRLGFDRCAEWMFANARYLKILPNFDYEIDLRSLKPLSEFIFIAKTLKVHGHESALLHRCIREIWEILDNGDYLHRLCKSFPEYYFVAEIVSDFSEFGCGYEDLKKYASKSFKYYLENHIEVPYYEYLGASRSYEQICDSHIFSPEIERCWIFHEHATEEISEEMGYAIAHEIFYLTNFGVNRDIVSENVRSYVSSQIFSWIKKFDSNLDISAELGVASLNLGLEEAASGVCRLLISNQNEDGSIPSPTHAGEYLLQTISPTDECHKIFIMNYHTTFISFLFFYLYMKYIQR